MTWPPDNLGRDGRVAPGPGRLIARGRVARPVARARRADAAADLPDRQRAGPRAAGRSRPGTARPRSCPLDVGRLALAVRRPSGARAAGYRPWLGQDRRPGA